MSKSLLPVAAAMVLMCGEAQDVQGPNLTPESRRAMQDELQRRKTDCRSVAAEVALRREDALHELVYGSPDDP